MRSFEEVVINRVEESSTLRFLSKALLPFLITFLSLLFLLIFFPKFLPSFYNLSPPPLSHFTSHDGLKDQDVREYDVPLETDSYRWTTMSRNKLEELSTAQNLNEQQIDFLHRQVGIFSQRLSSIIRRQEELSEVREKISQLEQNFESEISSLHGHMNKLSSKVERQNHWMERMEENSIERMKRVFSEIQSRILPSLVQQALNIHGADKAGMPDYAEYYAGARIVSKLTSRPIHKSWLIADDSVTPGFQSAALTWGDFFGNCFAFPGDSGNVTVSLSTEIRVTAVSVDHISRQIDLDPTSAPREFAVWGFHVKDWRNIKKSSRRVLLGRFLYDANSESTVQTFQVDQIGAFETFKIIQFEFLSNWGNNQHTCVYRTRVHGIPV